MRFVLAAALLIAIPAGSQAADRSVQQDLQAVLDSAMHDNIKADPACTKQSGGSALVLIDMQSFYIERTGMQLNPGNQAKIKQVIKEQIEVIKAAKDAHIPIVVMEMDIGSRVPKEKAETNSELKQAIGDYQDVKYFKKVDEGMFDLRVSEQQRLKGFLHEKHVGTLVMIGANGASCVRESIEQALDNECNVVAYNKAIADFNFPDFIYPYVGKYGGIKPDCADCTLKEASSLEQVHASMINNSAPVTVHAQETGVNK